MKKLNMTISILFIMFTANCIGMKATDQRDSTKADDHKTLENENKFKDAMDVMSFRGVNDNEKIYTDNVAVPELTILFDYIHSGKLDEFKSLLRKYPELKLMKDSKGNDALIVAAYHGDEVFIKFLLSNTTLYSMNFYNINDEGENAFVIACNKKNWKAAKYILDILPDNLPDNRSAKFSLEEGLEIINSSNDKSSECEDIKKLINAKLKIKD